MNKKNNRKGFTTVELVIVIAVIAILAAVMIPVFSGLIKDAQESAALSDARNAYTEYLSANAKTGTVVTDGYIASGNYYFQVVDGAIQVTALPALPDGQTAFLTAGEEATEPATTAPVVGG